MENLVDADDVCFGYDDSMVIGPVSLGIRRGHRISIVGPSGSGKSTLIYLLSGLLKPSGGVVRYSEEIAGIDPKPAFGLGFQSSDLVPWLSALDNTLLPLRLSGCAVGDLERSAALDLLGMLGLDADSSKLPREMSGGMKKRVSLARALVTQSPIVLLDEPFGELDEVLRRRLVLWLDAYLAEIGSACILVTHSFEEAIYFADEVLVLNGSPSTISGAVAIDRRAVSQTGFLASEAYRAYEAQLDRLLRNGVVD